MCLFFSQIWQIEQIYFISYMQRIKSFECWVQLFLTHRNIALLNSKKGVSLALTNIAMCEKLVSFGFTFFKNIKSMFLCV